MITKQQALEFIYDLSQKYEVTINSYIGTLKVKNNDYDVYYDTPAIDKGLEGAVQEFIKLYPEIAEKASNKIPVDVDMLEVGQTYEIEYDNYGEIDKIIDKLTKITIDEYRNNCRTLHFDRYCSIQEGLILEIYLRRMNNG